MKLSVIIPTYNGASLLQRSLDTWTRQTLSKSDYEVIIVDNNSTDHTKEVVDRYLAVNENIKYFFEPIAGATHARHLGAKMAKAPILVFADNDGLFNEQCLEAFYDVFVSIPEVMAVTGQISIQWDREVPEWIQPYEFMLGKLNYGDQIVCDKSFYLNGGLFAVNKKLFFQLGGFNPDLIGGLLIGDGDTGFVNKLHKHGVLIAYTPKAIMSHLQFVDVQGTVKDVGRRFYNVGVSTSYAIVRESGFKCSARVAKHLFKSTLFAVKKGFEYLWCVKNNKAYFSFKQRMGEIAFFKYLLYPTLRKEILNDNLLREEEI